MNRKFKFKSKKIKRNYIMAELHMKHSANAKQIHQEWLKAIRKLNRLTGEKISFELCIYANEE